MREPCDSIDGDALRCHLDRAFHALDAGGASAYESARELSQLASAWREDCSKADQIRFESERQVILSTAGKEVIYQIQEDRIERRCKWKDPQLATACTPEDYPLGIGYQAKFNSPYLVIYMIDPVGQIASTRLRVLGKTAQKPYRILEDKP